MFGSRKTGPAAAEDPTPGAESTLRVVSQLMDTARIDTVYRDLYMRRAEAVFAHLLPEVEYDRLKAQTTTIDDLLRQARLAVERGDWQGVPELAGRVRTLRRLIQEKRPLIEAADRLYGWNDVPIDPLSADLSKFVTVGNPDLTKTRVLALLAGLEESDPGMRSFYGNRRAHFQALSIIDAEVPTVATGVAPGQVEREAIRAIGIGDMDLLDGLAREVLEARVLKQPGSRSRAGVRSDDLSSTFPEETIAQAKHLGLQPAHAAPSEEFSEYLRCCCAWGPTAPDRPLTETIRQAQGCTCGHTCPATVPGAFKETMDLLIVHPFINSRGTRYLPRFTAEDVLIEEFPEDGGDALASPLLSALGLKRRRAVSRREIEHALVRMGPEIVEEKLGLDPVRFLIVCVPFDLYSRLGRDRGWGQQELWTHFDGYQIWKGGRLRALVGGSVRFGGLYDLCSISVEDGRDNVVARFAVIRRDRLAAS